MQGKQIQRHSTLRSILEVERARVCAEIETILEAAPCLLHTAQILRHLRIPV